MDNELMYRCCHTYEVQFAERMKKKNNAERTRKKNNKMIVIDDGPVCLNLIIRSGEGIDDPNVRPCDFARCYCVVYWVDPKKFYCTSTVQGILDPRWDEMNRIPLGENSSDNQFLKLEVVRLYSDTDPGTSTGAVVVGRAKVPLPKELHRKIEERFGLVRFDGGKECIAEGHITLSMELVKSRIPHPVYCL